jgi:hypothetical protein
MSHIDPRLKESCSRMGRGRWERGIPIDLEYWKVRGTACNSRELLDRRMHGQSWK